jgi:hypothetical protein
LPSRIIRTVVLDSEFDISHISCMGPS